MSEGVWGGEDTGGEGGIGGCMGDEGGIGRCTGGVEGAGGIRDSEAGMTGALRSSVSVGRRALDLKSSQT